MRPVTKDVSSQTTSDPIRVNWRGGSSQFRLSAFVTLTAGASLTYTVEHTPDDPQGFTSQSDYNTNASWFNTDGLTGLSSADEGNISFPVQAVRLNVTAYTGGTATLTVIQSN